MHPHEREHHEFQDWYAAGAAYHDRREAELGAEWNNNWQDEWILTDRDVWVKNPGYHGVPGAHPEDEPQEETAEYQEAMTAYYRDMQLYFIHCQEIEKNIT